MRLLQPGTTKKPPRCAMRSGAVLREKMRRLAFAGPVSGMAGGTIASAGVLLYCRRGMLLRALLLCAIEFQTVDDVDDKVLVPLGKIGDQTVQHRVAPGAHAAVGRLGAQKVIEIQM